MSMDRPKRLNPAQKRLAAMEVVDLLIKEGHLTADQREGSADDIARYADRHMDGYEIAKALDDRACWDCDMAMLDALDCFGVSYDKQLRAAQRVWFDEVRPTPPAQPGQRVAFRSGFDQCTGTIDEIYEHGVAQFTVKLDGDAAADGPSKRRLIIDWEAATPTPDVQIKEA